ncbi:MAG TPA: PPOX class F420-dependent oxidoreductase [Ktedonobacterales bacterium]|nr:PPOX class F420-dependent oxidoreductase [Ktedonobacterales bacterium]
MSEMTPEQRRAFLAHGTRTGKLATTRADGRPHVVPIWFVLDGDDIILTTGASSVKARNMRRDPRVSLAVDDQQPPYSFVMVEGTATLAEDAPDLLAWATRIGARYMGADRAEEYGRRNGVHGELLVRITPSKFTAQADIAD